DQLHDQSEQGKDVQGAEHQRIVPVDRRFKAQQPQPVQREDHLDQQGTGEEDADQRSGKTGNDQQHGIAEYVAVEHAVFRQALGPRGDHVLLADLVEEAVLGQHGQGGKAADDHRRDRQHQMPEVIGDLAPGAQLLPVVGGQPAQREPVEITATGEQYDQQDRQQAAGNGVADDDQRTGPDIERRAVANGLADAQGNGDQIGDQRGPQPQGDGHRHLLDDQIDDAGITEKAVAEIEGQVALDHEPKALMGRLVEAVHALDLGDDLRIQPLGAAVAAAAGDLRVHAAGNTAGGALEALEVGDHLFHRAARGGLDDQEVDQQDAEQGGNDQQQTPNDVGQHGSGLLLGFGQQHRGGLGAFLGSPPGVEAQVVLRWLLGVGELVPVGHPVHAGVVVGYQVVAGPQHPIQRTGVSDQLGSGIGLDEPFNQLIDGRITQPHEIAAAWIVGAGGVPVLALLVARRIGLGKAGDHHVE